VLSDLILLLLDGGVNRVPTVRLRFRRVCRLSNSSEPAVQATISPIKPAPDDADL
jgi:hypothetical protein